MHESTIQPDQDVALHLQLLVEQMLPAELIYFNTAS